MEGKGRGESRGVAQEPPGRLTPMTDRLTVAILEELLSLAAA